MGPTTPSSIAPSSGVLRAPVSLKPPVARSDRRALSGEPLPVRSTADLWVYLKKEEHGNCSLLGALAAPLAVAAAAPPRLAPRSTVRATGSSATSLTWMETGDCRGMLHGWAAASGWLWGRF